MYGAALNPAVLAVFCCAMAASADTQLEFTSQPTNGTAGATLESVVVQISAADNIPVASNNVPVTLSLNSGLFASGTTTVNTGANGQASFNDLVIGTAGTYALTATASGCGVGMAPATSVPIQVGVPNVISPQGYALAAFLDSLMVEKYWLNGVSVNWLTGSSALPGGKNMTAGSASHCSAFAAAVADLLGIYILRQPDASDLGLANNQSVWLSTNQSGWSLQNMTNAQALANLGQLVVASYYNPVPNASGHIAVLRPSTKSVYDILANGPEECQSGIYNHNDTDVSTGFGAPPFPDDVLYYSHPVTNPIVPLYPILTLGPTNSSVNKPAGTGIMGRQYELQCSPDLIHWSNCFNYINPDQATNFWFTRPVPDNSASGVAIRFYRLQAR
jgi:hypothetical protein